MRSEAREALVEHQEGVRKRRFVGLWGEKEGGGVLHEVHCGGWLTCAGAAPTKSEEEREAQPLSRSAVAAGREKGSGGGPRPFEPRDLFVVCFTTWKPFFFLIQLQMEMSIIPFTRDIIQNFQNKFNICFEWRYPLSI